MIDRPIGSSQVRWGVAACLLLAVSLLSYRQRRQLLHFALTGELRSRTTAGVLAEYGPSVQSRFGARFREVGLPYPPRRCYLLAFKAERTLELWGADRTGPYRLIKTYPVLAASGGPGPKRKEGDRQVPEGFYRLTELNPNSQFHLSIRVDYPNAEDVRHAVVPRNQMGGDIFVHGSNGSIGCLAIGDPAIEEVFCVVAQVKARDRRILIAPADLRKSASPPVRDDPWGRDLYQRIKTELQKFR